jgi:hypothetical protein
MKTIDAPTNRQYLVRAAALRRACLVEPNLVPGGQLRLRRRARSGRLLGAVNSWLAGGQL